MTTASTLSELLEIERRIDEIDRSFDILDPSNSIEAQEIEAKLHLLRSYLRCLENSPKAPYLKLVS
jgi:hypothetical protein